jgi:uncharacterized membrane protein
MLADPPTFIWQAATAIYASGWLALFVAPVRPRFCWMLARTGAVILALTFAGLVLFNLPFGDLLHLIFTVADDHRLALLAMASLILFIGSWQVEDAPRHPIPHWALLPCLMLTSATGPIGFAAHIGLRDIYKWRNRQRSKTPE